VLHDLLHLRADRAGVLGCRDLERDAMSEKVINVQDLRKLVRKDAPLKDRLWIEQRFEEEEAAEQAEAKHLAVAMGAPPIPQAQLVYNHTNQTVGVAIKGAKMICPLPKGYDGKGLALAVLPGERICVTHPNHSPLLIDPISGTTRRL
jgi:hypothetical protein